ncbi:MAG: NAD(P)/FAD-dependent oxidoreductase [Clostridia bacterium]|nr:NAD(P)/FAD-dependent oxidoreductase [Clostridia bacterium]
MKVVVVGGGASGMLAAIVSARKGNSVTLIEKTGSLGNKLRITGKGRCNLTFEGDGEVFENNIVQNSKFMRSSFSNFDNKDVVKFFNDLGVKTKVERGGRIFPLSDDANEVVSAMIRELNRNNVKIMYNSIVSDIIISEGEIKAVITQDKKQIDCDKCIIATGGKSYSKTGSSGDGYILASKLGHTVTDVIGGLVPLKCYGDICSKLQGLTLKNISVKIIEKGGKILYNDFGELLFAHFGLTGPVILSASSKLNRISNIYEKLKNKEVIVSIDLKPALDFETLDRRICKDFDKYSNKEFRNSLDDLLPQKLIPVIIELSQIDGLKKVHQITKTERHNLIKAIKGLDIYVKEFMSIEAAIISCGGIVTNQIDPKTMESKIVKGLYFIGEVLDIDAYTGGYNLQIAFSTAYAAGNSN